MKNDDTKEFLLLPKGIALNKFERSEMCRIIKSALREIYKQPDFSNAIVNISGKDVEMQYINKAVNNRFLLKKIIHDPRREINTDIKTKEQLFEFVKENLHELFHPEGKHFEHVYGLLRATSIKGERSENMAFKAIEEMGRKKGLEIEVLKPRKVTDDVYLGIDGFFIYNDREFTIQIKPLAEKIQPNLLEYRNNSDYMIAYCDGFIKEILTDYLALTNYVTGECFLFQTRGIIAKNSFFLIPKKNFVQV